MNRGNRIIDSHQSRQKGNAVNINDYIHKASALTAGKGIICTVMGDAGVGKTTISNACFPKPLFMPVEQGLLSVPDADAIQRPQNCGEVLAFIQYIKEGLAVGHFDFKTLIIDSVSELETMATREVCAKHGVVSLGDIKGFGGGGYAEVGSIHRSVREECDDLINAGLNVVFIAHAVSKEEKFPDTEPYSRWIMQVGRAGSAQYLNQVDAVIHIKNAVNITKHGSSKAPVATTVKNQRILDMVSKPSTVSKNRFGINQDVIFHFNPGGEFNNPLAPIFGFDK